MLKLGYILTASMFVAPVIGIAVIRAWTKKRVRSMTTFDFPKDTYEERWVE